MSLLEQLRDRKITAEYNELFSKFDIVSNGFIEFRDHKRCAEILALWSSKFRNLTLTEAQTQELRNNNFSEDLIRLLHLVTDRWVSGDPSFKLLLKKSLQNLVLIRDELVGLDAGFAKFIQHAASYSQSDVRIAYGVLETVAKTNKSYNVAILEILPTGFIENSFFILTTDESRSGSVGRCLAAILGPLGPKVWFENTRKLISDPATYRKVMTYFIEPVLKQSRESQLGFGEFYELCKPLNNPSIEIGILKAGKNAKIDVSEQIRSSLMVEQSLTSLSRDLRYDALRLLCNMTHKLSEPVPERVFTLIIENAPSFLAEGEPRSRADVCSALRNLFIRVNISKSQASAMKLVEFLAEWCITSLCPGMPYRCLAMAGRLLNLCIELDINILSSEMQWHTRLMTSLLNCVVSDFNDIRETAVNILLESPQLLFIDKIYESLTDEALKLMASSRNGEAGARLLQFLNSRKPEAGLAERVVLELEKRVMIAEENLEKAVSTTRVHGFITSLRLTPSSDHSNVILLVRRVCDICTPPLMSIAPEGASEDLINYCWKAIKESSLLLEAYADSGMITGVDEIGLLTQLSAMLTDITHWGAFSAVPPAFIAIAKRNPEKSSDIVWKKVNELSSGSDSRSVTRRSAGLPLLITSCLQINFDEKLIEALFDLANLPIIASDDESAQNLEMSQVHGMNCIKAIITDAELSKESSRYLTRTFEQSLKMINSHTWSLRNCAAMLFSSLFKRLFGVRGLPVSASVFFQRYKGLKQLLYNNLQGVTRNSELHTVFPSLAILGKLKPVNPSDVNFTEFWEPVIELLASKSWKIRELAAQAIKSMTHPDEIVDVATQFAFNLNLGDQNETHGFGLAIWEILDSRQEWMIAQTNVELQKCQLHLSKAVVENCFMETSTVLYKCYVQTGGRERLVPFKDLPSYVHLNRSLSVFEAEQILATQKLDVDPMTFLHGFSPVLETLPSSLWTLQLARAVLKDTADQQLPHVRVSCLHKLEGANHISLEDRTQLSFEILQSDQPPSVREAAAALLSHNVSDKAYDIWLKIVADFSRDNSPVECRRSALKCLKIYMKSHAPRDPEFSILFRLVGDEEEDIRELACTIISNYFQIMPSAPGKCAELVAKKTSGSYLASILTEHLQQMTENACSAYNDSEDVMFVIEKESSYQDELRSTLLQLQYCTPGLEHKAKASQALELLKDLDFDTPLRANASVDLLTVKAIATDILAK